MTNFSPFASAKEWGPAKCGTDPMNHSQRQFRPISTADNQDIAFAVSFPC
jgi:hypothetical protein